MKEERETGEEVERFYGTGCKVKGITVGKCEAEEAGGGLSGTAIIDRQVAAKEGYG